MTGLIAALVEAWAELRIHKTRILLALIGVALSVAALTTVVGLGNMSREAMVQAQEQQGGRAATVTAEVFPASGELDVPQVRAALTGLVERYGVEHSSLRYQTSVPFQSPTAFRRRKPWWWTAATAQCAGWSCPSGTGSHPPMSSGWHLPSSSTRPSISGWGFPICSRTPRCRSSGSGRSRPPSSAWSPTNGPRRRRRQCCSRRTTTPGLWAARH